MIKVIGKILGLCDHKWKIVANHVSSNEFRGRIIDQHHVFIMQCEKCGNIKRSKG